MKKLLIILILSVILISGCTSDEKTNSETSTDSQVDQNPDTQSVDLIIKSKDVPGLALDPNYQFFAVPENTLYIYGDYGDSRTYEKSYRDTLPIGYRNVGEESIWMDQSGRKVAVALYKYDSNSGLLKLITGMKDEVDPKEEIKDIENEQGVKIDFNDPNIGDSSFYYSATEINTGMQYNIILFIYKNNYVQVVMIDENGKSFNDALRIAKLVKSRLD